MKSEKVKPVKGKYLVIETWSNEKIDLKNSEVKPLMFDSLKAAQEWIKDDARITIFRDEDIELKKGIDKTWGSNFIIVKVERVVRPCPIVNPDIDLIEVFV